MLVLIVRENNCGRAWVSVALACLAVRGVTSQLGRRGKGVGGTGSYKWRADTSTPANRWTFTSTAGAGTHRGSVAFGRVDLDGQERIDEAAYGTTAPFGAFKASPKLLPACWWSSCASLGQHAHFCFPLRCPRLGPGDQNRLKRRQGMTNKPGGQAPADGTNSTDCKLVTAIEFKAWSPLVSRLERCLDLLKAIY